MDPRRKLIPRILAGGKTIESRWYSSRRAPWNKIKLGDTIYFKDSGKPVTVRATVADIIQYEIKNIDQLQEIIRLYGKQISKTPFKEFVQSVKNKKYCILVFLTEIKTVTPFHINKKGFGNMSAWITLPSIHKIIIK
jgi:ASC-1-like (ASCH) protein